MRFDQTAVDWHPQRGIVSRCFYENDKSEVPPPQNSFNILEKENYRTRIPWVVVIECHNVNEMDMLIYRWNIVRTWWDS